MLQIITIWKYNNYFIYKQFLSLYVGDLGSVEYSYTSVRGELSLQLVTDGTGNATGFTGSFTKIYTGTNIRGMTIGCVCVCGCMTIGCVWGVGGCGC